MFIFESEITFEMKIDIPIKTCIAFRFPPGSEAERSEWWIVDNQLCLDFKQVSFICQNLLKVWRKFWKIFEF